MKDLKYLYKEDKDFRNAYEVCEKLKQGFRVDLTNYMLQEGLLFKGHILCIPQSSMRENIIKEIYQGSLGTFWSG